MRMIFLIRGVILSIRSKFHPIVGLKGMLLSKRLMKNVEKTFFWLLYDRLFLSKNEMKSINQLLDFGHH